MSETPATTPAQPDQGAADDRVIVDGVDITVQVALLRKMRTPAAEREGAVPISATFLRRMQSSVAEPEPEASPLADQELMFRI